MYKTTVMDFLPLWGIFLGSTVLIVVAIEIGFFIGGRKLRKMKDGETPHMGGAVAATLGLLAFMLAVTFGSGTSRWDAKKQLVLNESNAVATAFLRTDLLPEPQRSKAKRLLADYVDHRLAAALDYQLLRTSFERQGQFVEALTETMAEAKEFHSELWGLAVQVAKMQPSPITALFVNALNEVIDLHQERVTINVQQRMPLVFWITLYCLAFLAMGLTGYDAGVSRSMRNLSAWVVAFAFSTVILLVVALDRPQTSGVGQLPLLELQADMHAELDDR